MKKTLSVWLIAILAMPVVGQGLSLDQCRQMALEKNKKMEADRENVKAAEYLRQAAASNFFPRISANGSYMWNQKNLYLLSADHALSAGTAHAHGEWQWSQNMQDKYQQIDPLLKPMVKEIGTDAGALINEEYTKLYDALTLDVRHVLVGQVGITQPIFTGGKIVSGYQMAKTVKEIAEIKQEATGKDLIISVDEAYWRVVSVEQKVKLAHHYHDLLTKLCGDVDILAEEGLATKADQLKVRMKVNEAKEKVGQAEDGLVLSRMALSEVTGMDLNEVIMVDSTGLERIDLSIELDETSETLNTETRHEIQLLEKAEKLAKTNKQMAASSLMPNIVAQANYLMMNKNFEDGIKNNTFYGWFNAGVVVNLPIAHPDAICRLKAAQHQQKAVRAQLDEAREMLTLQATQSRHKVQAAQRKLIRTHSACESAQEVLRMAREGFEEGIISSADLMAAETQWMSAESDRIDAAIELRLAELTYRKHTGKEIK